MPGFLSESNNPPIYSLDSILSHPHLVALNSRRHFAPTRPPWAICGTSLLSFAEGDRKQWAKGQWRQQEEFSVQSSSSTCPCPPEVPGNRATLASAGSIWLGSQKLLHVPVSLVTGPWAHLPRSWQRTCPVMRVTLDSGKPKSVASYQQFSVIHSPPSPGAVCLPIKSHCGFYIREASSLG